MPMISTLVILLAAIDVAVICGILFYIAYCVITETLTRLAHLRTQSSNIRRSSSSKRRGAAYRCGERCGEFWARRQQVRGEVLPERRV